MDSAHITHPKRGRDGCYNKREGVQPVLVVPHSEVSILSCGSYEWFSQASRHWKELSTAEARWQTLYLDLSSLHTPGCQTLSPALGFSFTLEWWQGQTVKWECPAEAKLLRSCVTCDFLCTLSGDLIPAHPLFHQFCSEVSFPSKFDLLSTWRATRLYSYL